MLYDKKVLKMHSSIHLIMETDVEVAFSNNRFISIIAGVSGKVVELVKFHIKA